MSHIRHRFHAYSQRARAWVTPETEEIVSATSLCRELTFFILAFDRKKISHLEAVAAAAAPPLSPIIESSSPPAIRTQGRKEKREKESGKRTAHHHRTKTFFLVLGEIRTSSPRFPGGACLRNRRFLSSSSSSAAAAAALASEGKGYGRMEGVWGDGGF